MAQLPECPESLKKIQNYMKVASEHDGKDPVISYWCRLYALQSSLALDKSSKEAKVFLVSLMEWLEKQKVLLKDTEMITNETAAQAYIENYALKLFNVADGMDRSSNHNRNTVKLFFTAGLLLDVATIYGNGELSEEIANVQKYAKWKATNIHNCLKTGEPCSPGPPNSENEFSDLNKESNFVKPDSIQQPTNVSPAPSTSSNNDNITSTPYEYSQIPGVFTTTSTTIEPSAISTAPILKNGKQLTPDQIAKAQKYCKFAASALNYDDIAESVANLQKALKLLTTGED